MIRNSLSVLIVLILTVLAGKWLLSHSHTHETNTEHMHHHDHHAAPMADEADKGPRGGRYLQQDSLAVEITLFEKGIPPEFHVYVYDNEKLLDPGQVELTIELTRLDGEVDRFNFQAQDNYLRGDGIVTEPHSFDVDVTARYQGETYRWSYENHEGRTQIPAALAETIGIKTAIAGPKTIKSYLQISGKLQVDPNRQSQVRAAYPGIVKTVRKQLGDPVKRGDRLLTIQNNESLQNYSISAPINGVITKRNVQSGESTNGEVLYEITDLSQLWVELDIFSKDASQVKPGQLVTFTTFGGKDLSGQIDKLWPIASSPNQTMQAIVKIENTDLGLMPGEIVNGKIMIAERDVDLAVHQAAIQSFRDFNVVFARYGEIYEVRMLELGQADEEWIEVLDGLKPDTEYVVENSYLIKADIEKSGASHDH